jgi:hypothetical protein
MFGPILVKVVVILSPRLLLSILLSLGERQEVEASILVEVAVQEDIERVHIHHWQFQQHMQ